MRTLYLSAFLAATLSLATGPAAAQSIDNLLQPDRKSGDGGTKTPPKTGNDRAPAGPAQASFSPQQIRDLLQEMGYKAVIGKTSKGRPQIASSAEGIRIYLYFYGCSKEPVPKCGTIGAFSGFRMRDPVPYSVINNWNKRKRFARAYHMDEARTRVYIEMDFELRGVTPATFKRQWRLFLLQNRAFRQAIRFNTGQ